MKRKVFTVLKKHQICPRCGYAKKKIEFKRPKKGGILPMIVHSVCNLCYKMDRWYKELNDYDREMCHLLESAEDYDGTLIMCENCQKERYGERRSEYKNKNICDICWQQYSLGLWELVD